MNTYNRFHEMELALRDELAIDLTVNISIDKSNYLPIITRVLVRKYSYEYSGHIYFS